MTLRLLGMHQRAVDFDLEVPSDTGILDLREADLLARQLGLNQSNSSFAVLAVASASAVLDLNCCLESEPKTSASFACLLA
eukprot:s1975_g9.t1